jgi:hypothetical protein
MNARSRRQKLHPDAACFSRAEREELAAKVNALTMRGGGVVRAMQVDSTPWRDLEGKLRAAAEAGVELRLSAGQVQLLVSGIAKLRGKTGHVARAADECAGASGRRLRKGANCPASKETSGSAAGSGLVSGASWTRRRRLPEGVRRAIVDGLRAGEAVTVLAARFGVRVRTVQYWRERTSVLPPGRVDVGDWKPGPVVPLNRTEESVVLAVVHARLDLERMGQPCGATFVRERLAAWVPEKPWLAGALPSRATIGRILRAEGRTAGRRPGRRADRAVAESLAAARRDRAAEDWWEAEMKLENEE